MCRDNSLTINVLTVFWAGELVQLKHLIPRNLVPHAHGPFAFIRYTHKNHVTALLRIEGWEENVAKVLIANLLPY